MCLYFNPSQRDFTRQISRPAVIISDAVKILPNPLSTFLTHSKKKTVFVYVLLTSSLNVFLKGYFILEWGIHKALYDVGFCL